MNTATMTTKTKAGAKKTIYRACKCGETAHDLALVPSESGGRWAYVCRNCKAPRFTKART